VRGPFDPVITRRTVQTVHALPNESLIRPRYISTSYLPYSFGPSPALTGVP
jgi:hypothetical protein